MIMREKMLIRSSSFRCGYSLTAVHFASVAPFGIRVYVVRHSKNRLANTSNSGSTANPSASYMLLSDSPAACFSIGGAGIAGG